MTFLAGVSGLTAAWPVVAVSKQEPEPALIPLPRGTERTVLAPYRRPGLVMTSPLQEVKIRVNYVSFGVLKRTVLKPEQTDKACSAKVTTNLESFINYHL